MHSYEWKGEKQFVQTSKQQLQPNFSGLMLLQRHVYETINLKILTNTPQMFRQRLLSTTEDVQARHLSNSNWRSGDQCQKQFVRTWNNSLSQISVKWSSCSATYMKQVIAMQTFRQRSLSISEDVQLRPLSNHPEGKTRNRTP